MAICCGVGLSCRRGIAYPFPNPGGTWRVYDEGVNGLVLLVVVFAAACSSSDQPGSGSGNRPPRPASKFECYKSAPSGVRECAPHLSRCGEGAGCFEREEAYCFQYLLTSLRPDQPDEHGIACTATAAECDDWHKDREHVENHPEGPCVRARPDEYFEPHR